MNFTGVQSIFFFSFGALLLGCGPAQRTRSSSPSASSLETVQATPQENPRAAPCLAGEDPALKGAQREDLNGDGVDDWIVIRYSSFDIYVAKEGPDLTGCAEFHGSVNTGHLSSVYVFRFDAKKGEKGVYRPLVVETWLMHGDRKRQTCTPIHGRYVHCDEGEEIPGPRRR